MRRTGAGRGRMAGGAREELEETSLQGRIAFRSVKASAMMSPRSAFGAALTPRDKHGAEARVGREEGSPELGSSPPPRVEAHGRGRHPPAPRKNEEHPCAGERASGQKTRRSSGKVCATPPALAAGTASPLLSADDEPLASDKRVREHGHWRGSWRRTRSRSTHTWQPGAGLPGGGKAPANTVDDDSDQGRGDGLSAYEKARLKRIADNHLTLQQLGIAELAQKATTLAPKKPHGCNKRRCVPVPCAEHERACEVPALCMQAQAGLHQSATSACKRECASVGEISG